LLIFHVAYQRFKNQTKSDSSIGTTVQLFWRFGRIFILVRTV